MNKKSLRIPGSVFVLEPGTAELDFDCACSLHRNGICTGNIIKSWRFGADQDLLLLIEPNTHAVNVINFSHSKVWLLYFCERRAPDAVVARCSCQNELQEKCL